MSKDKVNEGLFGAAKRFSDAFFDGLSKNTANRVIKQAEKRGLPPEAIAAMKRIERDNDILNKILRGDKNIPKF